MILLIILTMVRCAMAQAPADDAAQRWGLKQMSHMLADRPVMKTFIIREQTHWVTREDTVWKWVAERYAGKVTGTHAAWREAPPAVSDAMHAYGDDKVYIYQITAPARRTASALDQKAKSSNGTSRSGQRRVSMTSAGSWASSPKSCTRAM